ncbi:MAG: prolipoprotein diacylglyceryl transferase [Ktedonobacteraceae bacterium]|nr:prolipoprotein diacylglyceryl transferase [Ktedonobacteraceae bacterium]
MGSFPLAYALDWGWLRIGPPYIYLNIDPVIVHLGPLAVRWYGLMYVVAIIVALWTIRRYTERKGINADTVYRILWWCIGAGLVGGRLYFVIQQEDLVSGYLLQPWRILATWEGGMAFFGAIFLVIATLFWRARVERLNPFVLVDAGVIFAASGQIFGRIGNIINGDIIGYVSALPWSTVYQNPNSWACLNPATCNVPVQPAAVYELLTNLVMLAVLLFLARRLVRPGVLGLVYLYGYAITQFLLFFTRDNVYVKFLGLDWGLKQAQWTSLVLLVVLLPITYWVLRSRYSRPVPAGESAARYGIVQKSQPGQDAAEVADNTVAGEQPEPENVTQADEPAEVENVNEESEGAQDEEQKLDSKDKAKTNQA